MGIGTLSKAMQIDYEAKYLSDSPSEVAAKRSEKALSSVAEDASEPQPFFQEGLTKPTVLAKPEVRSDIPLDEIEMGIDLDDLGEDASDVFKLDPQPDGKMVIKPNMTKIAEILKKNKIDPQAGATNQAAAASGAAATATAAAMADPTTGPVLGRANPNQVSTPDEPSQEPTGDFIGSGANSDRRVADDRDTKPLDQWEMMKERLRNAGVVSFFIQGFFLMIAMFLNRVLGIKAFSMGDDGQIQSEPMPAEEAKSAVKQCAQALGLVEQDDPNGPTAKMMKEFEQSRKISSEVFLEAVESVESDLSQSYKDLGEVLNQIPYGESTLGQELLESYPDVLADADMTDAERIGHLAVHHDDAVLYHQEDDLFQNPEFVTAMAGIISNMNDTQTNVATLMARYGLNGKKPENDAEAAAEAKLQKKLNVLQSECFALNDAENFKRLFDRAMVKNRMDEQGVTNVADLEQDLDPQGESDLPEPVQDATEEDQAADSADATPVTAPPLPATLVVEKAPQPPQPTQLSFAEMNERQRLDAVTGLIPGMEPDRPVLGKPSPYIGNRVKDPVFDKHTVPGLVRAIEKTPTAQLESYVTQIEFKPGARKERSIDYNPCWISPYIAYANHSLAQGGQAAISAKLQIQDAANELYRKQEAFKFMCCQPEFDRPVDFKERLIGFEYNMRRMTKSLVALGGMHPSQLSQKDFDRSTIDDEKRRLLKEFNEDQPPPKTVDI